MRGNEETSSLTARWAGRRSKGNGGWQMGRAEEASSLTASSAASASSGLSNCPRYFPSGEWACHRPGAMAVPFVIIGKWRAGAADREGARATECRSNRAHEPLSSRRCMRPRSSGRFGANGISISISKTRVALGGMPLFPAVPAGERSETSAGRRMPLATLLQPPHCSTEPATPASEGSPPCMASPALSEGRSPQRDQSPRQRAARKREGAPTTGRRPCGSRL